MARIDVIIHGRAYPVDCADGEEAHVRAMASVVEARVRNLGSAGGNDQHLLVLTSLMLADSLHEAENRTPSLGGAGVDSTEGLLVRAVEHLTQRIEAIAERLEQP